MSRHSVREVKNTFEEILGENARVMKELDTTISYTNSDIETVNDLYTRALDKFVTAQIRPMNSEMLKTLSHQTGFLRDFEEEYKTNVANARAAEIRLNSLTTTHGDENAIRGRLKKLNDENEKLDGESATLQGNIKTLSRTLNPVDAFNAQTEDRYAGKPKLDAEGIGYFSSKKGFAHMWTWLTDGHYRQGRALIKSFAEQGADIPATQADLASSKEQLQATRAQAATVTSAAATTETTLKEVRSTAAQAVSENTLREKLKKDIIAAFDDEKFFNKVAKKLGGKFPVFIVEQRAKLDNLRKLQSAAQKSKQTVQQAGGKLDKHMSKLRKAASRSGSTQITIDLKGIKTSFAGMQQGVRTQATQVRQTSASVRDYNFSSNSNTSSAAPAGGIDPLMFMAVIMMSDIHHVPTPDVSAVGDSFNGAAIDAAGVDAGSLSGIDNAVNIGNLDVSVPDISVSVPDISVPDISVPDISIDTGSFGGGFDGGGFSGGGFD